MKVALFERSGRGPELTPSGLELLQHVREMNEAANRFSLAAAGKSESIKGAIAITANEVTAAFILPPMLEKLQRLEPEIEIELIAQNSSSDLKRREADIAIRGYRPTQEDLITRKVMDGSAGLYASKHYYAELGEPSKPNDLTKARFIAFDRGAVYLDALKMVGIEVSQQQFSLYSENHLVQWEMVKQGLGIGIMANEVGLYDDQVVRILPTEIMFPYELWLTAHRELRTSLRIRRVFDFLAAELSDYDAKNQ